MRDEAVILRDIARVDTSMTDLQTAQRMIAPVGQDGHALETSAAEAETRVQMLIGGTATAAESATIAGLEGARRGGARFAAALARASTELQIGIRRLREERAHLQSELEAARAARERERERLR